MKTQTIDLAPLSIRADVGSVNEEARTVELIFSTGAAVARLDYWTGKRYLEVLSLKPDHIRLDRLNAGAPLLDSHSAWSVGDVLGTVEPGTARVDGKRAFATVRFSKRTAVDPIWQDVRDGIIRNVSVGYRVHKFEEKAGKENELPVRTAIDWEPFEVSMVPMPADAGARVRAGDKSDTNVCVIVATNHQERTMNEQSATIVEPNPLGTVTPEGTERREAEPVTPSERDLGADAERARCEGILLAVRAARLPQSFALKLIADKTALVRAQSLVFEELAKRDVDVPRQGAATAAVQVGDDPLVHVRSGIENALLHRVAPNFFKLEDVGRQYRGLTLIETARLYLGARGIRTTGMSKMEIAGISLGLDVRGGMHTVSDFPLLLADVANKTLRAAYNEAPQTFAPIARRITFPDFKVVNRVQLGEAPQLQLVNEHGEFTRGTIGEGREQFQLATYGRVFAITRRAIVNDDTDAFSRVSMLFGRAARNLESDLVWTQITTNPLMADGLALFIAGHGNLDAVPAAIAVATLDLARQAMRQQTGIDGATRLNIVPKYLIVPTTRETVAQQFVTAITPATGANVNPFSGQLQVICEPRLDTGSLTAWYLGASPDQIDMIEYGSLEGEEGPVVETRVGFDVDGIEVKARHDFAAKVIDHRGFFMNPGV